IVITSSLPTPDDDCRTGTGLVNLAVINPGLSGTNYNWYDAASGGTLKATATTTYSPSISATTTYYVQDMSAVSGSVGPTVQFGANYGKNPTSDARYNLWFNTGATAVTLNYVTVWAWFNTAGTTYYINLRLLNNSNVVQATNSVAVSNASTGWQQKRIPVGFNLPANVTGWKLDAAGTAMSPVCDLNYASAGAVYPYNSTPSSGMVTITGQNDVTWEPNGYSFFYNWEFSSGTSCARLPVIATVGSCGALPVNFSSFNVFQENGKVKIQWSTSTEVNNSHFEIERSSNGIYFETIGKVNGKGNSNINNSYQYMDVPSQVYGTWYYRIKQVDYDGNAHTTETIPVALEKQTELKIYPMPVREGENLNVLFDLPEDGAVDIQVKDVTGKIIYSKSINGSRGINEFVLNASEIVAGVYVLTMENLHTSINKSIVIVK
ncbi:MAG: T9SS type A sorting domain-containing protein, partial [Cytophagaceae bacterium]|nr:T9SS type A sorting domain-containing protein [Cytophagaceae bacterium]